MRMRGAESTGTSTARLPVMLSATLATTLVLAGCASQDPAVPVPAEQSEPVVVGADARIAQQAVMAEVYAGALERRGREAAPVVEVPADERMLAVQSGTVTLSFGCTGELLGLIDPATARELAEEYLADDDPGKALSAEWRDRVYGAMSAALPGEIMATDPSNAQGCGREDGLDEDEATALEARAHEDPGAVLPQHIVPFYLKPALTRADRVNVLNRVAGSLSTEELDDLTTRATAGENPSEVAAEWLDTSRFTTG
ncbi:type 2 periplasmic-binding domain-containing protein [Corynebacterium freneyi]|uniref:hypothetical protein n=1 Tax=Corynebacterium freneyi TaxID=134034 RepID=UPI001CCB680F|nr:hypothetical protein [Corynebacterium freneyi]UBI03084.1 hypothetical protein LA334_04590 [Corynebacterium freneyi]